MTGLRHYHSCVMSWEFGRFNMDNLIVDKKLFMSAMENLSKFLDKTDWWIFQMDEEANSMDDFVHELLIPAVRQLEEASGVQLETESLEMPDD